MWAGRRPTANNRSRNRYGLADGRRSLVVAAHPTGHGRGLIVPIEPRSEWPCRVRVSRGVPGCPHGRVSHLTRARRVATTNRTGARAYSQF